MAVTAPRATTDGRSAAPCAGRGKSRILAMPAPERAPRVVPVPPRAAELTRPPHGRRDDARPGRKNRRLDRIKERPARRHGIAVRTRLTHRISDIPGGRAPRVLRLPRPQHR